MGMLCRHTRAVTAPENPTTGESLSLCPEPRKTASEGLDLSATLTTPYSLAYTGHGLAYIAPHASPPDPATSNAYTMLY
jgi:hypothetical protein